MALPPAVGRVGRRRHRRIVSGRPFVVNAETVGYLTRTGGYSRPKAERLLGWIPQVSLGEGMARTEAWLRAEGHLART